MTTRVGQLHPCGRFQYESVAESDQTTFAKQRVKAVFPAVRQEITNKSASKPTAIFSCSCKS
jgi:hypothetical protein